jgi:hypothetical protein
VYGFFPHGLLLYTSCLPFLCSINGAFLAVHFWTRQSVLTHSLWFPAQCAVHIAVHKSIHFHFHRTPNGRYTCTHVHFGTSQSIHFLPPLRRLALPATSRGVTTSLTHSFAYQQRRRCMIGEDYTYTSVTRHVYMIYPFGCLHHCCIQLPVNPIFDVYLTIFHAVFANTLFYLTRHHMIFNVHGHVANQPSVFWVPFLLPRPPSV